MVCTSSNVHFAFLGCVDTSVTFGSNQVQLMTDHLLLTSLTHAIDRDPDIGEDIRSSKRLLQLLLKDEIFRVHTWLTPLTNDVSVGPVNLDEASWPAVVRVAWRVDPNIAVHLSERFVSSSLIKELRRLILENPEDVIESPVAAQILLGENLSLDSRFQLKAYLMFTLLTTASLVLGSGYPSYRNKLLPTVIRR